MEPDSQINFDLNTKSEAFKCFYNNHFIDTISLSRNEDDRWYFDKMSKEEIGIASELLRRNIKCRYEYIIESIASIKDVSAIPELQLLLNQQTDLGWQLIISRTIFYLNGDLKYFEFVRKIPENESETLRWFNVNSFLDFNTSEGIFLLINTLNDESKLVSSSALNYLNFILTGKFPLITNEPEYSKEYFLKQKNDLKFINSLVNLNNNRKVHNSTK